jgi:outer membrane protein TolC
MPRLRLLLPLLLSSGAARAQSIERLTVDDAVRIALGNQPLMAAAGAQLDGAAARTRQAWALFFPYVQGSFAYNPQTANFAATPAFARVLAGGGDPNAVSVGIDAAGTTPCVLNAQSRAAGTCKAVPSSRPGTSGQLFDFYSAQLAITGTLFDFGRSYYGVRAGRAGEEAASEGRGAVALQVALDARVAFYGALAADQLVAVAEESLRTQQRHRDQMRGFFDVGTRTRVDVAQAEAELAQAQLGLARAHGQREAAQAQLSAALGLETFQEYALVPPSDPADEPVPAETAALDEAVHARPEPRQFLAQARAAGEQRKSIRGSYFPWLTLSLGPSFAGVSVTDLAPNFQATLQLGYPLLGVNPVLVDGQMREARDNEENSRALARASRNAIRLETAQALAQLRAAREAVVAAESLLRAATERRTLANGRFESGLGTVLELSDAELSYVNARAQQVQAGFDLGIARARLDKAMGR